MTNEKVIAEKLLQVNAVQLNSQQPFTWSSGWKSPIYCDNRKVLGFPYVRDFIKSELCNVVFETFPDADLIAGVATAGIAWGAMAADQLKLPFVYVRSQAKAHGMGNQVEGYFKTGMKAVVVEDLISTGKSSLQVCHVLQLAGVEISGLVAIFDYGFETARLAFEGEQIPVKSLSNYESLIELARDKSLIRPAEMEVLLNWRMDPAHWQPGL